MKSILKIVLVASHVISAMTSPSVTPISPPMILGEGPVWMPEDQSVIFVDFPAGTLNRIYTTTNRHQVLELEVPEDASGPSVVIPIEGYDGKFVVGLGHDLACVNWTSNDPDHMKVKPISLLRVDEQYPKNGFNDGKVDPSGRLWIGTKGEEKIPGIIEPNKATLFTVDSEFTVKEKVKEVTVSNGLAWSLDQRTLYYIDTATLAVAAFDYDDQSGDISNRRVVFDLEEAGLDNHYPDGMTIDNLGNLWVACYNGSKVINIDPDEGTLLKTVDIPSLYTTSCCFGGPTYSTLYVTSAYRGMSEEEIALKPDSGKTFAVSGLGVHGYPVRRFKVNARTYEQLLTM